ncbi:PucR family transcriptional regulator ligand-binding domain-containing protein [Intestinimonas butyriciproducens]|uniref:PucR family transcriptional regulator n=1 Tax=Intestinimonas butyriciproducens TaxID=1297617 RepID=UPI00242A3CB5
MFFLSACRATAARSALLYAMEVNAVMLTVMEVLSQPLFSDFEFLTNQSGLYNVISGVGIFEWESKEVIQREFNSGEFVITTLSYARENINDGIGCLQALIGQHVAAIAIKDIYFRELPPEIIDLANRNHTPILLFSNVNFEDIIFNIKNALLSNKFNASLIDRINELFRGPKNAGLDARIKNINPFFRANNICCYCRPASGEEQILSDKLDQYYRAYLHNRKESLHSEYDAYTLVKYPSGILVIYSTDDGVDTIRKKLLQLLYLLNLERMDFRIGISTPRESLNTLPASIWESIYACATSVISKEPLLDFCQIGVYQFLCALRHHAWVEQFYYNIERLLSEYDERHHSNLLETVLTYVKCDRNISLAAEMLFQHSNTIRYRLEKVKTVLGLEETVDYYNQLYVFATLYEIRQVLDHWDLAGAIEVYPIEPPI